MATNLSHQSSYNSLSVYFNKASQFSQQETLGRIVGEILKSGNGLSRKLIYLKLLNQLYMASTTDEREHLQILLNLMIKPLSRS